MEDDRFLINDPSSFCLSGHLTTTKAVQCQSVAYAAESRRDI